MTKSKTRKCSIGGCVIKVSADFLGVESGLGNKFSTDFPREEKKKPRVMWRMKKVTQSTVVCLWSYAEINDDDDVEGMRGEREMV